MPSQDSIMNDSLHKSLDNFQFSHQELLESYRELAKHTAIAVQSSKQENCSSGSSAVELTSKMSIEVSLAKKTHLKNIQSSLDIRQTFSAMYPTVHHVPSMHEIAKTMRTQDFSRIFSNPSIEVTSTMREIEEMTEWCRETLQSSWWESRIAKLCE